MNYKEKKCNKIHHECHKVQETQRQVNAVVFFGGVRGRMWGRGGVGKKNIVKESMVKFNFVII